MILIDLSVTSRHICRSGALRPQLLKKKKLIRFICLLVGLREGVKVSVATIKRGQ